MKRILLVAVMALSLPACKCPEKTTAATAGSAMQGQDTAARTETKQQTADTTDRLVVSFISIGEGTFPKAKGMMDEYIRKFEEQHNTQVTYTTKPWGREGESDQYFDLKNLTAEQQAEFVHGIKELFEGNQLIIIEENRVRKSSR